MQPVGTDGTSWKQLEPDGTSCNQLQPVGTSCNQMEPAVGTSWNHGWNQLQPDGTMVGTNWNQLEPEVNELYTTVGRCVRNTSGYVACTHSQLHTCCACFRTSASAPSSDLPSLIDAPLYNVQKSEESKYISRSGIKMHPNPELRSLAPVLAYGVFVLPSKESAVAHRRQIRKIPWQLWRDRLRHRLRHITRHSPLDMVLGVELCQFGPITADITLQFCVQDAGCGAMQWDTSHSRHQRVPVHRVEMLVATWDRSGTFDVISTYSA